MAFYLFLSERHGSGVGSRWAFMGLAVKLGVSVRLPVFYEYRGGCNFVSDIALLDGTP